MWDEAVKETLVNMRRQQEEPFLFQGQALDTAILLQIQVRSLIYFFSFFRFPYSKRGSGHGLGSTITDFFLEFISIQLQCMISKLVTFGKESEYVVQLLPFMLPSVASWTGFGSSVFFSKSQSFVSSPVSLLYLQ